MVNSEQPIHPVKAPMAGNDLMGLTKREHFAVTILQGIISGTDGFCGDGKIERNTNNAIRYADELLKQLDEKKK